MNDHPDTAPPRDRLRIGRIEVDRVSLHEAIDAIEALVRSGSGGLVVTPNVDHVVIAERDAEFREAYAGAALSLADGKPLIWAAWLLGKPLPEKVSGSDLVLPLAERAALLKWRVYLLGGGPGVAEEAARRLRLRPGVDVVGADDALLRVDGRPDETAGVLTRIRAARPDLLFLALGAPKQEIWGHRHQQQLGAAVTVGVGASLDFISGRQRRAPRWMSEAGLEWLYRLLREPRRLWRRYLVDDPWFAVVVWRTWYRQRKHRRAEASTNR